VYGIDLLGYRYTGDGAALNRQVVKAVSGPVCVAGSVDSYRRLSELKELDPWGFTIGSAFFDHRFGDDIAAQIDAVCAYMERP
jgi:phosphoribosylformimino-5-aminoimidazole carboxamide ribonucleotide (ProFAR) isomerase